MQDPQYLAHQNKAKQCSNLLGNSRCHKNGCSKKNLLRDDHLKGEYREHSHENPDMYADKHHEHAPTSQYDQQYKQHKH